MENAKHYYIGSQRVTKEEAEKQKKINDEALKTDDFNNPIWGKVKFIMVFENGKLCRSI